MIVGAQTDLSGILLAHHAKGRTDLCQNLQQVSKVQQYYQATVRRVNPNDSPMAVCSVGVKYHRVVPNSGATAEVPDIRHRLLHKMGGS